jgi:hypothetical protein
MQISSTDVVQRLRAADHLRNLHDLTRAASEVAAGKAISAAAFRKRTAIQVAGIAQDRVAAPSKKAVKRKTRY